jgi:hypothetical protein
VSFGRQTRPNMNIIVSEEDSRRQVEGFPPTLRAAKKRQQAAPLHKQVPSQSASPPCQVIRISGMINASIRLIPLSQKLRTNQHSALATCSVILVLHHGADALESSSHSRLVPKLFGDSPGDRGSNEHRRGRSREINASQERNWRSEINQHEQHEASLVACGQCK